MKINIRALRWVFLALYAAHFLALLVWGFFTKSQGNDNGILCWLYVGITLVTQALFIFCSGTMNLCKPIRRRRLIVPLAIAAALLSLMAAAFLYGLMELFRVEIRELHLPRQLSESGFLYVVIGINWIIWAVVLYVRTREHQRFTVMQRIVSAIFAGSLAELLAAIPAHVIVTRRPGCLVGLQTSMGLSAGLIVMFWTFGPGIVLLFLQDRRKAELAGHIPVQDRSHFVLKAFAVALIIVIALVAAFWLLSIF